MDKETVIKEAVIDVCIKKTDAEIERLMFDVQKMKNTSILYSDLLSQYGSTPELMSKKAWVKMTEIERQIYSFLILQGRIGRAYKKREYFESLKSKKMV